MCSSPFRRCHGEGRSVTVGQGSHDRGAATSAFMAISPPAAASGSPVQLQHSAQLSAVCQPYEESHHSHERKSLLEHFVEYGSPTLLIEDLRLNCDFYRDRMVKADTQFHSTQSLKTRRDERGIFVDGWNNFVIKDGFRTCWIFISLGRREHLHISVSESQRAGLEGCQYQQFEPSDTASYQNRGMSIAS
ncbi:hypothetical protein CEXT_19511 [Caerostris extrusa]|uniref:TF-B3 domain-containing protein n=1 Tax=Caerostris extrusa TaxID=172846 RepID=A0AAV4VR71_CAEEX|nr:hypothetical protein CEXT_19511 [Caerostris extrusa]